MNPAIESEFLGTLAYADAMARMDRNWRRVADEGGPETILLLEHEKVLTHGRNQAPEEGLLATPERLADEGIEVVRADRGGQWTYHGPGQLVAYFVVDLKRRGTAVRRFVEILERAMIRTLESYGVAARCVPGTPGVYTGHGKAGFIGLRVRDGVTSHGISLNLRGDLTPFSCIVPCGQPEGMVTSVEAITGEGPATREAASRFVRAFETEFAVPVNTPWAKPGGDATATI